MNDTRIEINKHVRHVILLIPALRSSNLIPTSITMFHNESERIDRFYIIDKCVVERSLSRVLTQMN